MGSHLLSPARGGVPEWCLCSLYSLGWPVRRGSPDFPLGSCWFSWYLKYIYFFFDAVVPGVDEPPVHDIQILNSFGERRPLAQLAVVGLRF